MRFAVDARELSAAVTDCAKACSKDNYRAVLQCVEMVCRGQSLTITALDGFNMIQRVVPVTSEEDGSCVVRPTPVLNALRERRDVVAVSAADNTLSIEHADGGATIRLHDGEFIKHEQLWTNTDTTSIFVNAEYLVKVASALKNGKNHMVELVVPLDPVKPMVIAKRGSEDRGMVLPIRVHD